MPTLAELYPALGLQQSPQFGGGLLGNQGNPGGNLQGGSLGSSLGNIGSLVALSRMAQMNGGGSNGGVLSGLGGMLDRADNTPPPDTTPPGNPPPGDTSGLSELERARLAIGRVESGNRYGITGPRTRYGPAYGQYQVLETNIGPWTERWYGQRLTPQEFLASPEAQDAVFRGQFGSYLNRHGNVQDAASMWFTGRPYSVGRTRTDRIPGVYSGISGEEYVRRFMQGF